MAKTTLHMHLARAEESVMKGELQIARQRKLVEDLARDGHRTTEAVVVLERYVSNHAKLIEDWEKLRAELEAASTQLPSPAPPTSAAGCECPVAMGG